ncbi:hypothetical protein BDV40DRAFT_281662 [Aspergillus tamarii]|uniref:Uncharacterized protein n=1 Tax=Aspergillus tamarii TaxID=41984 RepID=A0A5N6UCG2_ASPTM|nr:hypothetical protein BDV40DRAFT_281662 [Aspergillus tamarii]
MLAGEEWKWRREGFWWFYKGYSLFFTVQEAFILVYKCWLCCKLGCVYLSFIQSTIHAMVIIFNFSKA